jgi:hypothetical protein
MNPKRRIQIILPWWYKINPIKASIITILCVGVLGWVIFSFLTYNRTPQTITDTLPTSFRRPTLPPAPHIAHATIEHIDIPHCAHCSADIVTHIDGVPDETIIHINDVLTYYIFDGKDIRDPRNRSVSSDVASIQSLHNQILYIDYGVIEYSRSFEAYIKGAAHPTRDPGSVYMIEISNDPENIRPLFDRSKGAFVDQKVLEHFYPNGRDLFMDYIHEHEDPDNACYTPTDFPQNFLASFRPLTREVVFLDGVFVDANLEKQNQILSQKSSMNEKLQTNNSGQNEQHWE